MSEYDYHVAQEIIAPNDFPFDALIMAALMKADTENYGRLSQLFPRLVIEFEIRYITPPTVIDWQTDARS